jgi:ABC-type multidrug transport system fused ATPase/permease subunit
LTLVLKTMFKSIAPHLQVLLNVWIARWSEAGKDDVAVAVGAVLEAQVAEQQYYLNVYLIIAAACVAVSGFRSFVILFGYLRAAKELYSSMQSHLLKAPTMFFDTTPLGRILNRLASDTNAIDVKLPELVTELLDQMFGVLGTVAIISISMPV